ncbi:MAG: Histone deacetylase-like amidohydrolase [Chroococcidiopsis cubana SAG 39.79]|uniref:Histone deacetylase n=1 Tax=Chroococcidiopsis cubana SAG 39.79 TaxID=388085 RepID=A0AB37UQL0_9CYAN|nr:histone deacetylase [Chroococcidiopsis cubana]MDZ4872470.1 Histone deacetylase-like amidohydrolase [Chroococcidiopsis cubana SAG 39.79]PSB63620.1 histone deacetylase [Chroococcidiopsis cubana CCALA 043]RUT13693.1 histone deacetylase [Chroococcidiopsis cubana SAG 39.79]
MLAVIYSDEFLEHKTGRFHPEKPERISVIASALQHTSFAHQLEWRSPVTDPQRAIAWLEKVHSPHHIQSVRELATQGGGYLDLDTPVSPRSYDVALLAVNAWLDGIDYTLATNNPAFVLSRPPGHHAESDRGMGFCLFSNAAIAAHYALEKPNIERVAILDWDVHHGNGTQAIVENHPQIAFCSLHQSPCYPGTGTAAETGAHNNVLNLPLPPGSTIADYQPVFETQVMPFLTQFQPDLLIVSAGYDANAADPLAEMYLQPQDYGLFTEFCLKITHRIVFGLEGGYDLPALSQSVVATIERCLF